MLLSLTTTMPPPTSSALATSTAGTSLSLEVRSIEDLQRLARLFSASGLFARCLTAGMRTHCPDALGGSPAYTPEELGVRHTDEHGMPVQAVQVQEIEPAEDPDDLPMSWTAAEPVAV